MSMKLGTISLNAVYLGTTSIAALYLGAAQVFGGGAVEFDPAFLFASGEEGAWYEPSTTTAFTDTTASTAATYGDPVAFLLDKSQGAGYADGSFTGLGSEVVTNGTFDTDVSGWSQPNGVHWVYDNGAASHPPTSLYRGLEQDLGLVAGKVYVLDFDLTIISGILQVNQRSTIGGSPTTSVQIYSSGPTRIFLKGTDGPVVAFGRWPSNFQATIDNISVRELNGNHATQTTLASRPILARVPEGGRRNLFTYTEDFTDAAWSSASLNINVSGSRLSVGSTSGFAYLGQASKTVTGSNVNTWEIKYVNNPWVAINFGGGKTTTVFFNIQTGTKGTESAGYTGTITPLADDWYRISLTGSPSAGSAAYILICDGDDDITCTAGRSVDARFPQVETGSTVTAYQKVVDEYDITEAGVTSLDYLSFDGVDDFMVTPTITPGIDKVQVFAGVRKLSDASTGVYVELGNDSISNSGAFVLFNSASSTVNGFGFLSRGTIIASALATAGFVPPVTAVLTALGDIASDSAILRGNGSGIATSGGDQGTGNYLAYPMYIGMRAGTSLPFTGNIYSLITRFGANLDTSVIENTEAYLAAKSGVTL